VRDPARPRLCPSVRLLDGRLATEPPGDDRDLILDRPDRCRDGDLLGDPRDRGDRLLVALFRQRRRPVPRSDAAVHGGDGGLLLDGRPVQSARVLRADGRRGLRPHRVPDRGARSDPRRDQLRDHQQRGHLRDLHRARAVVRPDGGFEHGADRRRARRPPRRRPRRCGDGAPIPRLPDQGGRSSGALLAGRCACGRAHAGVRPVLRRDGRARRVRGRAALLDDLRRRARPARRRN
jgi:hypothetical protein